MYAVRVFLHGAVDATNAKAHFGKGYTLACLQEHAQAIECFDAALRLDPQDEECAGYRLDSLNALLERAQQ